MNSIAQIKAVAANGPQGPTTAMMIALNVDDAADAERLVTQVAEQFKTHRTLAPPNTSIMLMTIIGGLSAGRFAELWKRVVERDGIVRGYMSLMQIADVVQGTPVGRELSRASLLPDTANRRGGKSWWKFW